MKDLGRLEELVDRLDAFASQARIEMRMAKYMRDCTIKLVEMVLAERETAKIKLGVERLKLLAEKEIGPWFWRCDPSVSLEGQYRQRAKQLFEMGYNVNWMWDLLKELMMDWEPEEEVDEELLRSIIKEAVNGCSN